MLAQAGAFGLIHSSCQLSGSHPTSGSGFPADPWACLPMGRLCSTAKSLLLAAECPMRGSPGRVEFKLTLRTQAAAPAKHPRMLSWARIFFVHGTMPARHQTGQVRAMAFAAAIRGNRDRADRDGQRADAHLADPPPADLPDSAAAGHSYSSGQTAGCLPGVVVMPERQYIH